MNIYITGLGSGYEVEHRQVPIWDIFTEEEILAWAEIVNYKYFAQKGPEPVSHGRSWGLASRTLRHLLDESGCPALLL